MGSPAAPSCSTCDNQADDCTVCGGRKLQPLICAASVRGARWAERVVRALVLRWPTAWPRSPKSLLIAVRQVEDLAQADHQRQRLARYAITAAAKRYAELTEYLLGRRLQLPPAPTDEGATNE